MVLTGTVIQVSPSIMGLLSGHSFGLGCCVLCICVEMECGGFGNSLGGACVCTVVIRQSLVGTASSIQ